MTPNLLFTPTIPLFKNYPPPPPQKNSLKILILFNRNGESPLDRTPSPRNRIAYHPHYDTGFFDTISNVVENSKGNRGLRRQRRHYPLARHRRGKNQSHFVLFV